MKTKQRNVYAHADAVFSDCGLYRYWLRREWSEHQPCMLWIMLNPSTADGKIDDPTIRKCVGFAKWHHFGSIEVVNLYGYRATQPAALWSFPGDKVGPNNLTHVGAAAARASRVVCAWGAHAKDQAVIEKVLDVVGQFHATPRHLGKFTKNGNPAHPLMLPYKTPMIAEPLRTYRRVRDRTLRLPQRHGAE